MVLATADPFLSSPLKVWYLLPEKPRELLNGLLAHLCQVQQIYSLAWSLEQLTFPNCTPGLSHLLPLALQDQQWPLDAVASQHTMNQASTVLRQAETTS